MRSELQAVLNSLSRIPREQLPELYGELQLLRARVWLLLSTPIRDSNHHHKELPVKQIAERLEVTKTLSTKDKEFYTVPEAAEKLRVKTGTINAWLSKGKLRGSKVGRRRIIRHSELLQIVRDDANDDHKTQSFK